VWSIKKIDKIEDLTSEGLKADLIKIKDSNKDIITDRTLKNRLYGVVETSLDAILMKMDLTEVYGKAFGLLPNKSNNDHVKEVMNLWTEKGLEIGSYKAVGVTHMLYI
jgi:hypothetical protein